MTIQHADGHSMLQQIKELTQKLQAQEAVIQEKDKVIQEKDQAIQVKNGEIQTILQTQASKPQVVYIDKTRFPSNESVKKKGDHQERRTISWAIRQRIADGQGYKCKDPFKKCVLPGGRFQYGIYQIDHIIPFHVTYDDSESNLQALCPGCHALKR
eukprot:1399437-Prymnesium_polylepis.1